MLRLQSANSLRVFEPLAQRIDKDRIQPVDAVAVVGQKVSGAGAVITHRAASLVK